MAKKLAVQLDLKKIRTHLARADRRPYTELQVQQWLIDAGFLKQGGVWVVAEKDLGQLEPDEVISVDEIDDP